MCDYFEKSLSTVVKPRDYILEIKNGAKNLKDDL
jgi:hypothetical protein